jgi:hypothetical protein
MRQKQKKKRPADPIDKAQDEPRDLWSDDQNDRGYYYDDAHGYQIYKPDEEEGDPAEDEKQK